MVVDVDTGCLFWFTTSTSRQSSSLAEVGEHGVDEFERLVDLLTDLGTSQDNLAGNEDEEYDLGLHHAVDEAREELGLVRAEHVVTACQTFETDRELDVARANNVLNLEVRKLRVEAKLLDDTSVLAAGKLAVILGLGTSDDHLARGEDQGGRLGLTDTHDDGGKTLWVVFGITGVQGDGLQIETTVKVDRSDDVSLGNCQHPSSQARKQFKGNTHCSVGTIPLTPWPAPGVAAGVAGVAGVTPLPCCTALPPCD